MRNVNTPAPVYLHPAAATNPHTIRAIERATRRFACPDHTDPRRRVRLVQPCELVSVLALPRAGGAA